MEILTMYKKINSTGLLAAAMVAMSTLSGCEETNQLPVGSTAEIFPSEVQWNIQTGSNCNFEDGPFNDQRISVALKDADGLPLIDAPLTISLDLSDSTFNSTAVLALYDDTDGDGLFNDNERVSTDKQSAYNTRTNSRSGSKLLMVRVNLSCPYKGSLYAFAGNAGVLMNIAVVADDSQETETADESEASGATSQ